MISIRNDMKLGMEIFDIRVIVIDEEKSTIVFKDD